jgi:SAM-dependent methyltransferase
MSKIKKPLLQSIMDLIFFPIRCFFDHKIVSKFGLTSLQTERYNVCMPYIKGNLLDIGCGIGNKFIKKIGHGIGMDPFCTQDVDIVAEAGKMPFYNNQFQTITLMGSLRYMENRLDAMQEINRVIDDDGLLLILENHPLTNLIRAILIWWDPYIVKGINSGKGITTKEMVELGNASKFRLKAKVRYVYGISIMYVFTKE